MLTIRDDSSITRTIENGARSWDARLQDNQASEKTV